VWEVALEELLAGEVLEIGRVDPALAHPQQPKSESFFSGK
jgi:hypothetical protein